MVSGGDQEIRAVSGPGELDVFISYTEPDESWAAWIAWQLEEQGLRVVLRAWDFTAGTDQVAELHRSVSTARRAIAVLSAAYLTSTMGNAEWQAMWEPTGQSLLVVRVEDCPRPGLLGPPVGCVDLFNLDLEEARTTLLDAVSLGGATPDSSSWLLGATQPEGTPPQFPGRSRPWGAQWDQSRSPFPGLAAFDASRAMVFKGREQETRDFVAQLSKNDDDTDRLLLAIIGPSGCGKSSLAAAGIAATLEHRSDWFVLPVVLPGRNPLTALAGALAAAGKRRRLNWNVREVSERLTTQGGVEGLVDELLEAVPAASRLLLVIDQADDLLQVSDTEKATFLTAVAEMTATQTRIVITLKSENFERFGRIVTPVGLRIRAELLLPLDRALLPTVIAAPARLAGLTIDDALVRRMVFDTVDGYALPLLAYTLQQLDLAAREADSPTLTPALYEQVGGVRNALIYHAEAALADARTATGHTDTEVLAALLLMVTVDADDKPVRRRRLLDELPPDIRGDLTPFVARRLLVVDATADNDVTIEVAHESLLAFWTPVAEAIADAAESLRLRDQVESAAGDWSRRGEPADRLWSFALAGRALSSLSKDGLSSEAWRFLLISRSRARTRWITVSLIILLVVAVAAVASFLAHADSNRARSASQAASTARQVASTQQGVATAQGLLTKANAIKTTDPRTALKLDLAAASLGAHDDATNQATGILANTHLGATLTGLGGVVYGTALSADGRIGLTGGSGPNADLWNLTDPVHPVRIAVLVGGGGHAVALSADGRIGVTDGIVWNLTDPAHPTRVDGTPVPTLDPTEAQQSAGPSNDPANAIALSADGHIALATDGRGQASLLDLTGHVPVTTAVLNPDRGPNTPMVNAVALSADGHLAVTDTAGNTAIVWNLTDPENPTQLATLTGHAARVESVAISADGRTAVTASGDKTAIVWNLTDPAHPTRTATFGGGADTITTVTLSRDGRTVLSTDNDNHAVIAWDLHDPAHPAQLATLTGHTDAVWALALSADGHTALTGGLDYTAIVWNLANLANPSRAAVLDHPASVNSGGVLSANGKAAITSSDRTSPVVWNLSDPTHPTKAGNLDILDTTLIGIALSADGHLALTADAADAATVWNLTDPAHPSRAATLPNTVDPTGLALTADGRTAVINIHGSLTVWNLSDPGKPTQTATVPGRAGFLLALSADGHIALTEASSQNALVTVWNLADPKHPTQAGFGDGTADGSVVAISADGHTALIGAQDGSTSIWNLTNPARPTQGHTLTGHTAMVLGATLSADGHRAIIGSSDETAIVWNLTDPNHPLQIATLTDPSDGIESDQLSADGYTALTSGLDPTGLHRTELVWNLHNLDQILTDAGLACEAAGGGLDQTTWNRYIPAAIAPYKKTCRSP
jgi:WD40 repeat protein